MIDQQLILLHKTGGQEATICSQHWNYLEGPHYHRNTTPKVLKFRHIRKQAREGRKWKGPRRKERVQEGISAGEWIAMALSNLPCIMKCR